jgi:hypothetical protein
MAIGARNTPVRSFVLACMTVFVVTSCRTASAEHAELRRALLDAPHQTLSATVDAVGIDAETGCLFGPYTPEVDINAALGFEWADAASTGIGVSDTELLVVVARDGQVVGWAMVPRDKAPGLSIDEYGCAPL